VDLSSWVVCEENLEGDSLTGEPEGYVEGSVDGHLSTGPLLGKLEGGSVTWDFERWMRQMCHSVGPLWESGRREVCLLGMLRICRRNALAMECLSLWELC
jgi:hypothetical protein